MNKVRDYRALEREFITSRISIGELCRRHGISAHSLVVVQAQRGKWQEKPEAYHAKADESFIERYTAQTCSTGASMRISSWKCRMIPRPSS